MPKGSAATVQLLVDHGAPLGFLDSRGDSPLHCAVKKALCPDNTVRCVMMVLLMQEDPELLLLLLEGKAPLDIADKVLACLCDVRVLTHRGYLSAATSLCTVPWSSNPGISLCQ